MIWKVLLLVSIVTVVGAQWPGHDDPRKGSLNLLSKLLKNPGSFTSSHLDAERGQHVQFPDLDRMRVNDGDFPLGGYPKTKGGVLDLDEESANPENTDDTTDSLDRYLPQQSYVPDGNGRVRDEILKIMDNIFSILKFQGLLTSSKAPVPSLMHNGFSLLDDYLKRKSIESKYDETECPYSFDNNDGVCLSFDVNAFGLTWYEARIYCQIIKGGDLAIFRDANEFDTILKYVRRFDDITGGRHDFWIGASSEGYNKQFAFINGDTVPYGTPFWGRRTPGGKQNPTNVSGRDFVILNHLDHYLLEDITYEESIIPEPNTVPLCRFYHGKERYSHYGYHSDYFYHESSNDIATKFKDIISVGTKNTQASNIPFGNQAPHRRIN